MDVTCKLAQWYLQAYSNVDLFGCPDDRYSTSGYLIFFGNLISWSFRKQPTVARSRTEIECKALANSTTKLIQLQDLLRELGVYLHQAPTL